METYRFTGQEYIQFFSEALYRPNIIQCSLRKYYLQHPNREMLK